MLEPERKRRKLTSSEEEIREQEEGEEEDNEEEDESTARPATRLEAQRYWHCRGTDIFLLHYFQLWIELFFAICFD